MWKKKASGGRRVWRKKVAVELQMKSGGRRLSSGGKGENASEEVGLWG